MFSCILIISEKKGLEILQKVFWIFVDSLIVCHAKRPMAVRGGGGGGGGVSNGRFPWTKWEFCSEVKKLY